MKYFSGKFAGSYSHAPDYFSVAACAIDEMVRQTGDAVLGEDGLLKKGVIVRHLILPGAVFDSKHVLQDMATGYSSAS